MKEPSRGLGQGVWCRVLTWTVAVAAFTAVSASAQTQVQDFRHVAGTDAMSDRDISYIATTALGSSSGRRDARLMWRCSGSTIEVVLEAPELQDLTGPVPVRWRFDQDPASDREFWRASSLAPLAHAPEATIYPFTEIATAAGSVLLRAEDAEGRSYDYRFSLLGLNSGLNRLACARHLEVLGERRAIALFEQAAATAGSTIGPAQLSEGGIPRLIEQFPFVGHRTHRRYMASSEACWRTLWRVTEVQFFRSEVEARRSGYAWGRGCGP